MGKTRVIAETGAGQHGVATATACALFGLECTVYMGEEDIRRQKLNVFNMRTLGAEVVAVTTGSRTLRDATNEAMRDWMGSSQADALHHRQRRRPASVPDDRPRLPVGHRPGDRGSSASNRLGRLPDVVVACVGGGSNAAGMFYPFIDDDCGRADRRRGRRPRADGRRARREPHARASPASSTAASATSSRTTTARPQDVHSISAGLDYPGVGPEHSYWKDAGRVRYESVTDAERSRPTTHRPPRGDPAGPRIEPRHRPGVQGSPPARVRRKSSSSASPAAATRTPTRSPGSAASRCEPVHGLGGVADDVGTSLRQMSCNPPPRHSRAILLARQLERLGRLMNRIDALFARLKGEGRRALMPFVTAGDPDLATHRRPDHRDRRARAPTWSRSASPTPTRSPTAR